MVHFAMFIIRSACLVRSFIAVLLLTRPCVAADETIARVDAYVAAQMERHRVPALSIAVIRDGKIVRTHAYGTIDLELNVPNAPRAAFMIGSLSKQFAAAATMVLVEQKKIALDDPVSKYLVSLPAAWSNVTVRHLLSHTSGIPSYTEVPGFEDRNAQPATHDEVIATVSSLPAAFSPGERFHYNNTGYFLLGMLIEKVAGVSYEAFLNAHVFVPAGMTGTRLNDPSLIVPQRVSGYALANGKLVNPHYESMTWPYSGGTVLSTVEDLARWDAIMSTDKVLLQSSFQQMWTPMRLNDGTITQYGFGWHLEQLRSHPLIWHTGHINGFSSFFGRVPDTHLSVIVLTNQEILDPERIGQAVLGIYDSSLTPAAMLDSPPADPDRARTDRALGAIRDLAGDNRRSTLVLPTLLAATGPQERAGLRRLLDEMQSFRFLACDSALPANATRLGSSVSTLCYYRLTTARVAADLTIFLAPDGKLAEGFLELR